MKVGIVLVFKKWIALTSDAKSCFIGVESVLEWISHNFSFALTF